MLYVWPVGKAEGLFPADLWLSCGVGVVLGCNEITNSFDSENALKESR